MVGEAFEAKLTAKRQAEDGTSKKGGRRGKRLTGYKRSEGRVVMIGAHILGWLLDWRKPLKDFR